MKTKKSSLKTQILKNELKNKDFSYLITKVRFQISYVSQDKKTCSSVVSIFFPRQRNLLPVDIVRNDTLWITLLLLYSCQILL